jgi:hypothetical protein
MRAAEISGASGGGAPRRAIGGDAPMAGGGKHRRRSWTRRAAAAHHRPSGDDGCTRRGRLRQQRRWILEERTRCWILGGVHTMSSPQRRAPQSGVRWRPPPATMPAFLRLEQRRRTSLCDKRWRIDGPVLSYFIYIFMPTSIGFYDTLWVHGSPSIFFMFWYFYSHFM